MFATAVLVLTLTVLLIGCLVRPGRMFPWLLVALSAHILLMALGYVSGVNPGLLRLITGWKELALVAVVVYGLMKPRDETGGLLAGRGYFQAILITLVAFVGLHVLATLMFGKVADLRGPLLELRVLVVMMLAYYAGKVFAEEIGVTRMLKHIVWVAVACSVWGLAELFLLDEAFWVDLGYPDYLRDFMGQHYSTPTGVQENWYTTIGGQPVRRAMSVFMSSQPFAKALIVALPAALLLCVWKRSRLMVTFAALTAIALLATLTRAIIVGMTGMIAVYFLGTRWAARRTPLLVVTVAVIILLFVHSETVTSFWEESLSFEDPSSREHVRVWHATVDLILEKPFVGHGGGSRAGLADRLSATVDTRAGEQTYLIFASQYGLPGLLLYVAVMIAVMAKSIALHRAGGDDPEFRMLGGVMFIMWGTIILDSLTTYMWGSPYISIVPWMLVGAADRLLAVGVRKESGDIIDFEEIRERAA